MSISNTTETAIMKLIFQAVAWASYADNAASTPQSQIGIALHTADPLDAGDATTSEVAYSGYVRVNVARNSAAGWTESSGTISPVSNIDFTQDASGTQTAIQFSTSKSTASPPSGAQAILFSGAISPVIAIATGVTPRLTTLSTITLD